MIVVQRVVTASVQILGRTIISVEILSHFVDTPVVSREIISSKTRTHLTVSEIIVSIQIWRRVIIYVAASRGTIPSKIWGDLIASHVIVGDEIVPLKVVPLEIIP